MRSGARLSFGLILGLTWPSDKQKIFFKRIIMIRCHCTEFPKKTPVFFKSIFPYITLFFIAKKLFIKNRMVRNSLKMLVAKKNPFC